jgi:hypothetical protein
MGVASVLALSAQVVAPLDATPTLPSLLNWLLLLLWVGALGQIVVSGTKEDRFVSLFALAALVGMVWVTRPWDNPIAPMLASRAAATLSSSQAGLAWTALVVAWAVLCHAWLCSKILLILAAGRTPLVVRLSAWGLGAAVGAFGLRAVIGYANGSTALIAG